MSLLQSAMAAPSTDDPAQLVSLQTIWTQADSGQPHNAFTDMIRYQDHWYIGLREALKHHGGLEGRGALRVLRSADTHTWTSVGRFVIEAGDLRDAKLSITAQGELMLNSAIQVYSPNPHLHKNFAWFSRDGIHWSAPSEIGEPDYWIWSITWHGDYAYGIGYPTTKDAPTRLYRSNDGLHWETWVSSFHPGNESSLVFDSNGIASCYVRKGDVIGQSHAPYTEWTWKSTIGVGGPKLFKTPKGQFLLGGRIDGWGTMKIVEIEPDTGHTQLLLELPARADSSYPGMVWHDGFLWVSYYTSSDFATEGGRYLVPTEIRLAKIKLPQ